MPRVERIREVLAGPLSASYIEKKTVDGWKPVVVVWEREVEGTAYKRRSNNRPRSAA